MCERDDHDVLLARLSQPAERHDPGLSRRRFLQGLLASGAAMAAVGATGGRPAHALGAASTDPVLVVVTLGGGNDGLNTVIPVSQGRYVDLRGSLAVTSGTHALGGGVALHPALSRLAARYRDGRVAVVQGVGQPGDDLSHFSSMSTFMAGTAGTDRTTGWLGRWIDGLAGSGLSAVTMGAAVPLHLVGQRATVTTLPSRGIPWGADRSKPAEVALQDLVAGFGEQRTGFGELADALAVSGRRAVRTAARLAPVVQEPLPEETFARDMLVAARTIDAGVGARVVNVTLGGWDTHAGQAATHARLLGELDHGIDTLFTSVSAANRGRVAVLVLSEFGRRPVRNSSGGTDHGTASVMFLVGDRVRGGLYGEYPSLSALDGRGNLARHVDFRQVYATVLGEHLGADPSQVLGAGYEPLGVFA